MVIRKPEVNYGHAQIYRFATRILRLFPQIQSVRVGRPRKSLAQSYGAGLWHTIHMERAFKRASEQRIEDKPESPACKFIYIPEAEIKQILTSKAAKIKRGRFRE
jgi:hypothetical protein